MKKKTILGWLVFALCTVLAVPSTHGQDQGLLLPPGLEKELAAKASDVTEVTLGKNMLDFAVKFLNNNKQDDEATRKLIEGLQGIYVREYEFDKEGQYSMEQVEQLRKHFATSEWTPIIHERERKSGESTDILVKTVNGQNHGMFVLTAEPKELTVVLILGPIRMEDLGKLGGLSGLGALGALDKTPHKKGGGE